jgi:superkiller protein 3
VVFLPDLAKAEPFVQEQLKGSYAALLEGKKSVAVPGEVAIAYGEFGKLLLAAEFNAAAEAALVNAQATAPGEMKWPYYLGLLYELNGDKVNAGVSFERAHKLSPRDVPTMMHLGATKIDLGLPDDAEALFARVLILEPRSAAAYYGLGRAALARRQFDRAAKYLEQAIDLNPNATSVNYPLSIAYRGLAQHDKAAARLKQRGARQVEFEDPLKQELGQLLRSAVSYRTAGTLALEKGQWADAIKHFRAAIALAPDEPVAHHKLGTALFTTGDVAGALEQFREAVRVSPGFAKGHFSLGLMMESVGQHRDAIGHFSAAIESEPNYEEAWLQMAHATRRSGRWQQAIGHYQRVLALDMGNAEAQFGYAASLIRLARYADARQSLSEGMTRFPNEPAFPLLLARVLAAAPEARFRDGRQAMDLVQKLLAGDKRGVELCETVAMVFAEVGDFDAAIKWQREGIDAARRAGDPLVPMRETSLKQYQAHRPSRVPWRADEPLEFFAIG